MAFSFKAKASSFRRLKKNLPIRVGNMTKNHFLRSFKDGGFTDKTLSPWAARKRSNKSDRRTRKRRAILVETGRLRRSIRLKSATFNKIEVGSYGVPYATYHNTGQKPQPRRQFIGKSAQLKAQIKREIRREVKNIFK